MSATLFRRSGCLALLTVLIGSVAWAQTQGADDDESAIRALIQIIDGGPANPTKARLYAVDADWTNAFGTRIHGRDAISQFFDSLSHNSDYLAGAVTPDSLKLDVRFVRPDVAVVHSYKTIIGQIDPTIHKAMPTRKIHSQYVLSKEDGKWLIRSQLVMDEEHYQKPK